MNIYINIYEQTQLRSVTPKMVKLIRVRRSAYAPRQRRWWCGGAGGASERGRALESTRIIYLIRTSAVTTRGAWCQYGCGGFFDGIYISEREWAEKQGKKHIYRTIARWCDCCAATPCKYVSDHSLRRLGVVAAAALIPRMIIGW